MSPTSHQIRRVWVRSIAFWVVVAVEEEEGVCAHSAVWLIYRGFRFPSD